MFSDATHAHTNAASEDMELQEYMKKISQEPWAISNQRLQKFVQTELNRPKETASRTKQLLNTASRLGFEANAHYTPDDLARTNPICTGEFSKLSTFF